MNERVHIMRQSVVKITQMLAGRSVQVTQQGVTAYVRSDHAGRPVVVNLPYMPDNATDELLDAIQGFLDHEVAHILFTEFPLMGKAHEVGAGNMLNLLEDTRIERKMAEKFEGSGYNLARTGKFFLDKYMMPKIKAAQELGDQQKLVAVLSIPLIRAMAGQQVFAEFMKPWMPTVAPLYDKIKDLEPQIQSLGTTADAFELAKEIVKRLRDDAAGDGEGEENEMDGSGKAKAKGAKSKSKSDPSKGEKGEKDKSEGKGDDEDDKEEGKGSSGEGEKDDDEEGSGKGEGEGEGEEGEGEGEEVVEGKSVPKDNDPESDKSEPAIAEKTKKKPKLKDGEAMKDDHRDALSWEEIDKETANDFDEAVSRAITEGTVTAATASDYLPYTKDNDVIEPLKVGREYNPKMLQNLQDKVEHMVSPLQKDLERAISARSLSQYSSGHRSGRLHAANLSRLAIERPGAGHDDRVFRRKHEATSKDVAVELVVDMSGSMSGSKIHTAAQAAYALAATLERIGIKSEVICFTTGPATRMIDPTSLRAETTKIGRQFSRVESLYMPILKGFDERMTTEVKQRFGWLPNCGAMRSNVDGESVEIAAMRLLARREKGKVMLVLSDGMPAASGSSADLQGHLQQVVRSIVKRGINVVGIGIESHAVQKFYPKNMVLNNVEELPGAVMKELRGLLIGK